jgi:hypothetical protein
MKTLIFSLLFVLGFLSSISAEAGQMRSLESVKSLRIMAYNVKDLYLRKVNNPGGKQIVEPKPLNELKGIALPILDVDPDIVILEEVDDIQALTAFKENFLGRQKYLGNLIEGNDTRGIDIGFLVKADLPVQLDMETHREVTWVNPNTGMREKVFSRDLPVVFVRRNKNEKTPVLIIVGNHGRSQRDRANDPGGTLIRSAQYQAAAEIIAGYMKRWPKVPIVMGGDFNTEVRNSPEVLPLRSILVDSFDIAKIPMQARTTHTFHPDGGERVLSQLDTIYVSPVLAPSVRGAAVYHYRDGSGRELPLPRTFEERARNPSDHFPVAIEVSTERIFPEAYAPRSNASGF